MRGKAEERRDLRTARRTHVAGRFEARHIGRAGAAKALGRIATILARQLAALVSLGARLDL